MLYIRVARQAHLPLVGFGGKQVSLFDNRNLFGRKIFSRLLCKLVKTGYPDDSQR
jgi:hypothetical protein